MKQSKGETDSTFGLLDSQDLNTSERFGLESRGCNPAAHLRLIISCRDHGLASDYLKSLKDGARQTSVSATLEVLSPEELLQRVKQHAVRPKEVVVFLDYCVTSQVLSLFAGLSQLAATVKFNCLVVVPSLLCHISPCRRDGMQNLLDQLSESFQQKKARSISSDVVPRTSSEFSGSVALKMSEALALPDTSESRLTIVRTGFVLSPSSSMTRKLRKLRPLRALAGSQLSSTFLEGSTLFDAIESELGFMDSARRKGSSAITIAWPVNATASSSQEETECVESPMSSARASTEESSLRSQCSNGQNNRQLTILGSRRSWDSVINEVTSDDRAGNAKSLLSVVCRRLGIQSFLAAVIRILIWLVPSARQVHFDTLKPRTVREIISLYNRYSCRDIQLAGYNNGVNHFGWKFPDKTVVLTTGLPGKTQLSDASILDMEARLRALGAGADTSSRGDDDSADSGTHFTVDAGLTLKHCIQELSRHNREFYVVPNYSWISMGTLFFVPVHGSGSQVSTLGDTIEDVLLYNGETEQFIFARRGDKLFRDAMYDTSRHRLLLRLTLRVKPKGVYSVKQETLKNPSAADVLKVFGDHEASNVEIRKNRAASNSIDIRRYYIDPTSAISGAMEMPRDGIGRVWDRLEETPIVSSAFHWFVRRFAFHVELILKHDEFAVFWKHHQILPVSKIQLRQMLRDGMTNSACAREDCICADLFMTRGNRDVFLKFISTHLPNARFNPGKQSL